jgi:hypothetical protein
VCGLRAVIEDHNARTNCSMFLQRVCASNSSSKWEGRFLQKQWVQ